MLLYQVWSMVPHISLLSSNISRYWSDILIYVKYRSLLLLVTYVYLYNTYIYICIYVCIYIYVYMCVYIYVYMCVYIYIYVYIYNYVYTNNYIYIYIYNPHESRNIARYPQQLHRQKRAPGRKAPASRVAEATTMRSRGRFRRIFLSLGL